MLAPVPSQSSIRVAGQRLEVKSPIAFPSGSAKLSRESMIVIQELAPFLEQHPDIGRVEVQAHTADADAAASALSTERANAIRDALVLHGVPAARLTARGYGGSDPVKPADSPERDQNDRVVFVLEPATPLPVPLTP